MARNRTPRGVHLIPLSDLWDGTAFLFSTPRASVTGRNLLADGRVRLSLGPTRDVVLVDGTAGPVDIADLAPETGDAFATKTGFDPRELDKPYQYFLIRPQRIHAWREPNELRCRDLSATAAGSPDRRTTHGFLALWTLIGYPPRVLPPSAHQPALFSVPAPHDPELDMIAVHLQASDPDGTRIGHVLRRTYDMLLNGQHTGRYRWDELRQTEKTHFGSLLEINLQREFGFDDGQHMDFAICGIDVDCKYSQSLAEWMIPPEAMGHVLLGMWANDAEGLWSAGLVRARDDLLSKGNRDQKRQLSKKGRTAVTWVFWQRPLPENALLRIPEADVQKIFMCSPHGTKRVDMLFRLAQGRRISRTVVATVAQQDDYMKRVRGNGGSRTSLRGEGIVILGQYSSHCSIAEALALPVPGPGEFVSVRLASYQSHHVDRPRVMLGGQAWVVALSDDPAEQAPLLPETRKNHE